MSSIKKSKKSYTQVSNTILNDENISLKAKGLFAFMDSKPDGWNFTIKSISMQVKDGKSSVESALKELKDAGYIKYYKQADGHGIYELVDEPKPENPNQENPNQENRDVLVRKINSNTDLSKPPYPLNRHSDVQFRVIVQTLRDKAAAKSKIKNSQEEYEAYLQIKDTSTLIDDYLAHQSAKGEYAKNFLNFLLDYNPMTLDEKIGSGEVVLWA